MNEVASVPKSGRIIPEMGRTPIADQIDLAFVFGSMAKGSERAESDIDLLVVTDKLA